jgi:hypothetical protein
MESSINERLKQSIEYKKINPPDIYNKIGVRRQIWGGWLNQNQAIPLDKLVKIIKLIPDIDARWLLTGQGKMINQPAAIPEMVEEPKGTYICNLLAQKNKRPGTASGFARPQQHCRNYDIRAC